MSKNDKSREKLIQKIRMCMAFGLTPKDSFILLKELGIRIKLAEIMWGNNK